jgi:hypothetical protein
MGWQSAAVGGGGGNAGSLLRQSDRQRCENQEVLNAEGTKLRALNGNQKQFGEHEDA